MSIRPLTTNFEIWSQRLQILSTKCISKYHLQNVSSVFDDALSQEDWMAYPERHIFKENGKSEVKLEGKKGNPETSFVNTIFWEGI